MRERTYLLTGSPHQFTTALADALLEAGATVWATVASLKGGIRALPHRRFHPVHGTQMGPSLAKKLVSNADSVVHVTIAPHESRVPTKNSDAYEHFRAARMLLDEAAIQGRLFAPLVIHDELPESRERSSPPNLYEAELDAFLEDIRQRALVGRLRFVGCRLHEVYGPLLNRGVLPSMIEAALEGHPISLSHAGTQEHAPLYVDDAVDAVIRLTTMRLSEGTIYNVASPERVTERELATKIVQRARCSGNLIAFDEHAPAAIASSFPSIVTLRAACGWMPRTSLDQGIARTVAHTILLGTGLGAAATIRSDSEA